MEDEASVVQPEAPIDELLMPGPTVSSVIADAIAPEPVADPRVAQLEAINAELLGKIERLRAAKNAYRKMAGFAAQDMAGAHSQGDIYSSRRKVELTAEFGAIKDED